MKNKVHLWYASIAFFGVVFLFGLWFMYKKTVINMALLFVLTALSCWFYMYCNKQIRLPGGYTAIQAHRFFKSCVENGIDTRRTFAAEKEKLDVVVKKYDFTQDMDVEALWKVFQDGQSIEHMMRKKN